MTRILHDQEATRHGRALIDSEPELLWAVVAWVGLAIAIVGWTDLALLWYPFQLGSPQWEFATISAHLDGMPLGTVGLALLSVGAIGRGWRRTTRVLAVVSLAVVVGLLAISIIYLLDVPIALRANPSQVKPLLKKAMLKEGVFAATYTVLYAWLGWFLWRGTRLIKGP